MGGLLTRAIGGAMQGAGAAMVDQAKAARDAAIAALKRAGEVEDRDTNIAATAHNAAVAQQAETYRAGMANQTSRDNAQGAEWTSQMNNMDTNATSRANTGATIKAENTRQGDLIEANKKAAGAAADLYGKPEVDGNGNLVATNQHGKSVTVTGADGKPVLAPNSRIPAAAIKAIADKSVDANSNFDMPTFLANMQQAEKVYGAGGQNAELPPPTPAPSGGYLSNVWGALTGAANQAPATGRGLLPNGTPQAFDPSKATATATNPKTGAKIFQIGGQWVDGTGKPTQ